MCLPTKTMYVHEIVCVSVCLFAFVYPPRIRQAGHAVTVTAALGVYFAVLVLQNETTLC